MSRPIKFRAWDKKEKTMFKVSGLSWRNGISYGEPEREVEDSLQAVDDATYAKPSWISVNEPYIPMDISDKKSWDKYVKDCKMAHRKHQERMKDVVLMQYTGLLDRNGKEIYEGDIVECDYDDIHDPTGINYSHPNKKENIVIEFKNMNDFPEIPRDCEVIGNIYENPNLLS